MKVAIDLTALLPIATGVDVYLKTFMRHLGRVDRETAYTVFSNFEDVAFWSEMLPENFNIRPLCRRPRPVRFLFQQCVLPLAANMLDVDVVHSPSFLMPFYRGRAQHVLTVYDMTFFSIPEHHTALRRSWAFRQLVMSSLQRAHAITAPSRATRDEILRFAPRIPPDAIRVIAPGIGEEFTPEAPEPVRREIERMGVPEPYILYVGTIEPRKNVRRLLESYRTLIADGAHNEHLVLAGRLGWGYEEVLQLADSPELKGRVHRLGYVPQADLPWLYRGARLFVYPSLQEGFGFPPAEAMACGVPTIAAHSTSMLEYLEGAAELVPPENVDKLTAAMRVMLRDEGHREQRRRNGLQRTSSFRWDETARQTVRCYREMAARLRPDGRR